MTFSVKSGRKSDSNNWISHSTSDKIITIHLECQLTFRIEVTNHIITVKTSETNVLTYKESKILFERQNRFF